jgi:hypothetical protein
MTTRAPRSHRWVLALFVGATFAYLLLVLIGPFIIGLWSLVLAVGIAGVGVLLARRHVRHRGRRPHVDLTLGWKQSNRAADAALAKEAALTFILSTFVVFVLVLGVYLKVRYPAIGTEAVLFGLGSALVQIAILIGLGILAEGDPRYALGVPFLVEELDTMEDH